MCCDLAINNSKLSIALFKLVVWLTSEPICLLILNIKKVRLTSLSPKAIQTQYEAHGLILPMAWLYLLHLQDNSLWLHSLALIYHSSTVPICGTCLVCGNSLCDVPISAGWQQVPPRPSAGTDSFLWTFSISTSASDWV